MPTACLKSAGEELIVWYDVYGQDATRERASTEFSAVHSSDVVSAPKARVIQEEPVLSNRKKTRYCAAPVKQEASTDFKDRQDDRAAKPPLRAQVTNKKDGLHSLTAVGHSEALPGTRQGTAALPDTSKLQAPASPFIAAAAARDQEDIPGYDQLFRPTPTKENSDFLQLSPEAANCSSQSQPQVLECNKVLFIAGLGARGRTEFFQHIVEHLATLKNRNDDPLLSVCTFDNRGIGGTTIPDLKRKYTTEAMALDTLALLDHLQWEKVHIVGMSLGGMIACKMAAMQPHRIASMMLVGTTPSGWHMLAGISTQPFMAFLAGSGPLKWKIPANLQYNFSDEYLEEFVGDKTRKQVLIENTMTAIREKDTEKFLAEGQPNIGRKGHLAAVFRHRLHRDEMAIIRASKIPCLVLVGRHDRLARAHYVSKLARQLHSTYIVVEAGHAGVMIEALHTLIPLLEAAILGNARTNAGHVQRLGLAANKEVLRNNLFAKEFASSFAPGRISFSSLTSKSSELQLRKSSPSNR